MKGKVVASMSGINARKVRCDNYELLLDIAHGHVTPAFGRENVFEHIPYRELTGMCGKIANALKPGGFLVARFPNGDSPFSLPIQNADPTHVHSIGSGIAHELMRVSGLEVVELRAPYETPVTLKSKIALPFKRLMRSLLTTYVRFTYLGASTPPTYALNYLLVARKPVTNLH